jgi:hypothetical protein
MCVIIELVDRFLNYIWGLLDLEYLDDNVVEIVNPDGSVEVVIYE